MDFWALYMFWYKTESLLAFHCSVLSQKREIEDHTFIYFAVPGRKQESKEFPCSWQCADDQCAAQNATKTTPTWICLFLLLPSLFVVSGSVYSLLFFFLAITLLLSAWQTLKIINQSFKQPDDVSLLQGEKVRGVPTDRSWGRGIVCEQRGSGVCARNIFSACIDSRRRTVGPEGAIWLLLQLRHRVRWVYPGVHCYSSSPTEDLWACLEVGGVGGLEGWISHVLLCEWKMGRFKSPASSIQDILLCLSLFLTAKAMHTWLPVAENRVSVFPRVFLHAYLPICTCSSVCLRAHWQSPHLWLAADLSNQQGKISQCDKRAVLWSSWYAEPKNGQTVTSLSQGGVDLANGRNRQTSDFTGPPAVNPCHPFTLWGPRSVHCCASR